MRFFGRGIEDADAGRLEARHVAGDDRHGVNKGGCRDVGIALRARTRHMKPGAARRYSRVDRQRPPGESRTWLSTQPRSPAA